MPMNLLRVIIYSLEHQYLGQTKQEQIKITKRENRNDVYSDKAMSFYPPKENNSGSDRKILPNEKKELDLSAAKESVL